MQWKFVNICKISIVVNQVSLGWQRVLLADMNEGQNPRDIVLLKRGRIWHQLKLKFVHLLCSPGSLLQLLTSVYIYIYIYQPELLIMLHLISYHKKNELYCLFKPSVALSTSYDRTICVEDGMLSGGGYEHPLTNTDSLVGASGPIPSIPPTHFQTMESNM